MHLFYESGMKFSILIGLSSIVQLFTLEVGSILSLLCDKAIRFSSKHLLKTVTRFKHYLEKKKQN